MTTFYFIRHGKTQNNLAERFNGGTVDTPLIPEGILATQRMGDFLKEVHFDAAFASPQGRAQKTAEIILAENQQPPLLQTDTRLQELDLGDWDGKKIAEIKKLPEFQLYFYQPDQFDAKKIHGESYDSITQRGHQFVLEKSKNQPQDNILVVSHGILLLTLFTRLKNIPLARLREAPIVPNSSLTILETDGESFEFPTWGQTF